MITLNQDLGRPPPTLTFILSGNVFDIYAEVTAGHRGQDLWWPPP